tara:strand:- start:1572 stop:1775 length:204 start_codon:yes stop_codon:yes gene_type:complete
MLKKALKITIFLVFVLILFSCTTNNQGKRVIDCKYNPDYERIGESALDSLDDMKRINLMQLKAACNF